MEASENKDTGPENRKRNLMNLKWISNISNAMQFLVTSPNQRTLTFKEIRGVIWKQKIFLSLTGFRRQKRWNQREAVVAAPNHTKQDCNMYPLLEHMFSTYGIWTSASWLLLAVPNLYDEDVDNLKYSCKCNAYMAVLTTYKIFYPINTTVKIMYVYSLPDCSIFQHAEFN